ncbi:MAG TPA: hypothetical protein PKC21_07605 [Oligoflexia bacterium]|nr:hypothetical protein [Oligoflexia bacterium]HMR25202.1 hypothetical protein [Oligoflexia bacterium]
MRHLYLGFLTFFSIFAFLSNAHAQAPVNAIASYAQHKHTYLIDKTIDYSKDDQLHLQANFLRILGDWTINIEFTQESRNKALSIKINDFEKVDGQEDVWQNAEDVWLYGQSFRLRTVVNKANRYLTIYIEDPEVDTRQNEPEIVDFHVIMQASANY